MARPKNDPGVTPAKQRLEESFWQMLAQMPFRDITIGAICTRAQVNHNTFYYYFRGLDQMASTLLEANLTPDVPQLILHSFTHGHFDAHRLLADPDLRRRFERVRLLAGPHADPWMQERLRQSVMARWLSAFSPTPTQPSPHQTTSLTFIVSGMFAVIGQANRPEDLSQIMSWLSDDFGPVIISVIDTLQQP